MFVTITCPFYNRLLGKYDPAKKDTTLHWLLYVYFFVYCRCVFFVTLQAEKATAELIEQQEKALYYMEEVCRFLNFEPFRCFLFFGRRLRDPMKFNNCHVNWMHVALVIAAVFIPPHCLSSVCVYSPIGRGLHVFISFFYCVHFFGNVDYFYVYIK